MASISAHVMKVRVNKRSGAMMEQVERGGLLIFDAEWRTLKFGSGHERPTYVREWLNYVILRGILSSRSRASGSPC